MYYDRRGKPCSAEFFAQKICDEDYRTVNVTRIENCIIMTMWTGIDQNQMILQYVGEEVDPNEPPLIFETAVHLGDCIVKYRHATVAEAMSEHDALVDYLTAKSEEEEECDEEEVEDEN